MPALTVDFFCVEDGDIIVMKQVDAYAAEDKYDQLIRTKVSKENMAASIIAIVSTKINWWLTSHHVGQEAFTGYAPSKVCKSRYGDGPGGRDLFYMIGHCMVIN